MAGVLPQHQNFSKRRDVFHVFSFCGIRATLETGRVSSEQTAVISTTPEGRKPRRTPRRTKSLSCMIRKLMLVRPQVANSDLRKTHIYRSHSRQTLGPVQEFGSSMVLKTPSHSPCTRQGLVFPETHSTVLQTFETPAPRKASQTLCSQFFRAPPLFVTCVGTQVGRGLGNDVPQTERARESKHNVLSKDFFRFPPFFGAKCGHG